MSPGKSIINALSELESAMADLSAEFSTHTTGAATVLIQEIRQAIPLFKGKISEELFANPPFIFMNQPHQWKNLLKANCQAMMTHLNRYLHESQPNENILKDLLEGAIKFLNFVNSHVAIKDFPAFLKQNELRLGFILESPAAPTFSATLKN